MLTDAFEEQWIERLNELGPEVFLLIDGAFIPGLSRRIRATGIAVSFLFEALPACSDATRDVSPFLVPWIGGNRRVESLLCECSGYPMVSAISSVETLSELTARLSAWCVIEADGQRFNFRFSDTRRLPAIFETLIPLQRTQLVGPASRWSYVGRTGDWRELEIDTATAAISDRPSLDDYQFARLVGDSEADEVIAILEHCGTIGKASPSDRFLKVSRALSTAAGFGLGAADKLAWCEFCTAAGYLSDQTDMNEFFERWTQTNRPTASKHREDQ